MFPPVSADWFSIRRISALLFDPTAPPSVGRPLGLWWFSGRSCCGVQRRVGAETLTCFLNPISFTPGSYLWFLSLGSLTVFCRALSSLMKSRLRPPMRVSRDARRRRRRRRSARVPGQPHWLPINQTINHEHRGY